MALVLLRLESQTKYLKCPSLTVEEANSLAPDTRKVMSCPFYRVDFFRDNHFWTFHV